MASADRAAAGHANLPDAVLWGNARRGGPGADRVAGPGVGPLAPVQPRHTFRTVIGIAAPRVSLPENPRAAGSAPTRGRRRIEARRYQPSRRRTCALATSDPRHHR